MKRKYAHVFLVLLVAVVAIAAGKHLTKNTVVVLGTMELKSGVVDSVHPKSGLNVETGPGTPEAKGKIKNLTGYKLQDVKIFLENKGTGTGTPPTLEGGSVTFDGNTASLADISAQSGGGWVGTATFNANEGISDGSTADFEIDISSIGTTPPGDYVVRVDGSLTDKPKGAGSTVHGDWLGKFILDAVKTGTTLTHHRNWLDRIICRVKNADASRAITQFACEISLPTGITISSVTLADPYNSFNPVTGASATIDGHSFTISGFTLEAGDDYEIVVVYSDGPETSVAFEINATFEE